MEHVLVCTVGGSPEPIIAAIDRFAPSIIYFICSKDSKVVVTEDISTEVSNMPPFETLIVDGEDEPIECYRCALIALKKAQKFCKEAEEPIVDFSGGTKSMSAGLVLAAVDTGCKLSFATGVRQDLKQVVSGTEISTVFNPWDLYAESRMKVLKNFTRKHFYSSCIEEINFLEEKNVDIALRKKLNKIKSLAKGLEAWERFDHDTALKCLKSHGEEFSEACRALRLIQGLEGASGYEKVFDLLDNACRRASQGRYDDACARVYRALEMFAQIRLKKEYNLDSSNIRVKKLPIELKEKYKSKRGKSGKIQLALRNSYELLSDLNDPVGKLYEEVQDDIRKMLDLRNYSILAHGNKPIKKANYERFFNLTEAFISGCCKEISVMVQRNVFPDIFGG